MATDDEYAAVEKKLVPIILAEEKKDVPGFLQGMIPPDAAQKAAHALARITVDTIDQYRAAKAKP